MEKELIKIGNYLNNQAILDIIGLNVGDEFELIEESGDRILGVYKIIEDDQSLNIVNAEGACILSEKNIFMDCSARIAFDLLSGKVTAHKVPFLPKNEETFFYIDTAGRVVRDSMSIDVRDFGLFYMGNCFRTYDDAVRSKSKVLEKIKKMNL